MPETKPDPLIGSRIREYEILDVMGKGGMGAVYRARHVYLEEHRAIKVIHTRFAHDTEFVNRFIREARILVKLSHPNLVRLHEFGTLEEGIFFMVLELLQGESVLDRILRIKRIPVEDSVRMVREAALGLHSAHLKGIVHRDISPDNLLQVKDDSGNETTKVLDFGIAKPNFEASMTAVNMFMGKLEYASPEQCGATSDGLIDARSDIYSLGATFYHMLTGQLPFYSKTPQGYIMKHAHEKPSSISTHLTAGDVSLALDRIIFRCMAKRKEERYESMEALVSDLDRLGLSAGTLVLDATQPSAAGAAPQVGALFAKRYEIDSMIGKGGMGTVFKAMDQFLDVPVALKIMNTIQNEKTLQRFKREVILARKVAHPNVCRTIDIGEFNGIHYVSMDFIEGVTLQDLQEKEGRLTPEQGIPIVRQVLRALEEAHRVGIVHRDLKPQNIMIDPENRAFIMDFGISISADSERVTQIGAIVGTAQYMSPEQIEGKEIDYRSDLYSMGVILFEMFTGRLPFPGDNTMAILYAHVKLPPEKPSHVVPGFPADLERVILKALEKDPAQRFQSATDFLQALAASGGSPAATVTSQETNVHRLLSEKNYTKAVSELSTLIQVDPENQEWKSLLKFAEGERLQKQVRRAEILIRKKELGRAETLLTRIRKHEPDKPAVRKQIRGLMLKIRRRRLEELTALMEQAESQLLQRDWEGVQQIINSATQILPDDSRIEVLRDRLVALQQNRIPDRYRVYLQEIEAEVDLARNEESETGALLRLQQAEVRLEQIRKDLPGLEPLEQLQSVIRAVQNERGEERTLKQKLAPVFDRLTVADAARALEMVESLLNELQTPDLRNNLRNIGSALSGLAAALSSRDYSAAEERLQEMIAADERRWLLPYEDASNRLREIIHREHSRENQFRTLFHQGKERYEVHQWHEAIQVWKKALELFPDDATVRQWLQLAEDRVKDELDARTKLLTQLNRCGALLAEQKWDVVRATLKTAERTVDEFRWEDLRPMLASIREQLEQSVEKEKSRAQTLERLWNQAQQLYQKGRFPQARQSLQELLDLDPEHAKAKSLLVQANEAIEQEKARRKAEAEAAAAATAARPRRSPAPILAGAAVGIVVILIAVWLVLRPTESKTITQARELAQQGRIQDGIAILREYLQQHPESPEVKNYSDELELQLKQQELRRNIEDALRTARQQREARNWEAAIRSYELALQMDPRNAEIQSELQETRNEQQAGQVEDRLGKVIAAGREALRRKQFDEAEKAANQAAQMEANHPEVQKLQLEIRQQKSEYISALIAEARTLQSQNKLPAAENTLQRALGLEPENAQAKQALAEIRKALETFGQGTISIQCEPFCRVFIDGKDMGDSPYARKPILAGTHTIRVRKPGFKEITERVTVKNGDVVDRYFTLEKQ